MIKLLLAFLFTVSAHASVCDTEFSPYAIQQGGRIKPLYVHARETLRHLTGKSSFNGEDPVVTYCNLSLFPKYGTTEVTGLKFPAEHVDLKKFLEMDLSFSKISAEAVVSKMSEIRVELMRQKEETSYKKSLNKLFTRAHIYKEIKDGKNWLVPMVMGKTVNWVPIKSAPFENAQALKSGLKTAETNYNAEIKSKHIFELSYAKLSLPHVAMLMTLLALASLTLFKKFGLALVFSVLTILVQTGLISARVYLS